MAKLPVRITDSTNSANTSGGVAHRSIAHFDEIAVIGSTVAAANVSGGVVPLGADEYAAMMLSAINERPAAWFRADTGVTVTGQGVSTLADQSGNGRDLLQSTDASRPPYLSYSGTKYLYLSGASGNYGSTTSTAARITGNIDIRIRVSCDDWTPATSAITLIARWNGAGNLCYAVNLGTTGTLTFYYTNDGSTPRSVSSSAGTGITDGQAAWLRITYNTAGTVNFYKADDSSTEPSSWTQIGSADRSITAGTIFAGTAALELGSTGGGAAGLYPGKTYRALLYSTIGGTTPVVDFNPNRDASDGSTSFASSATGETWTVNSSGGLPAQIVGRSSILFDGSADYLKTNAFTLNQPITIYVLGKAISWAASDRWYDGNAASSVVLFQTGSSPQINIFAGSSVGQISPTLNAYAVISSVFNGASSLNQLNNGSPVTGDAGTNNAGGFTLASTGAGNWGNLQILEVIIFPTAHDASQRARVIQYLAGRHGVAL